MKNKRLVRDFVKSINKDFKISFEEVFEVDIQEEHIYATFDKHKDIDDMFLNFIKDEFGTDCGNIFLASLLHEIGHIMTYDDDMDEDRDIQYGLLQLAYEEDNDVLKYNNMYFRIPAEYNATYWGIQYYRNNKEKCDKLIKCLNL